MNGDMGSYVATKLEEIGPSVSVALEIGMDTYFDVVRGLTDNFAGKKSLMCVYITSSVPSSAMLSALKMLEVGTKDIHFIDCISHLVSRDIAPSENTIYIDNPTMLENIILKVDFLSRKMKGKTMLVVLDSINSLAIHNDVKMLWENPAATRPSVETRMEDRQAVREERRSTMTTELQNRFINLVRNVFERMNAAITRLEDVATRLEARTTKLTTLGVDTGPALIPLSEAKRKLAEARRMLGEAKSEAESGLVSDTPRERFTATRAKFTLIREEIRSSFILLRESLMELKDAVMEEELNHGVSSAVVSTEPIVVPE